MYPRGTQARIRQHTHAAQPKEVTMDTKRKPLVVDGRYRYTLSSYEPVAFTIEIKSVTEAEVQRGIDGIFAEMGLESGSVVSDSWVAEHVPGAASASELRSLVREQLEAYNAEFSLAMRRGRCMDELSARLEQRVPAGEVARLRTSLIEGLEHETSQAGLTLADALWGMGMDEDAFNAMIDQQAEVEAAREAALDAMVDEYALHADETELPALLGLSPKDTQAMVADARARGAYGSLMRHAARQKALDIVEAEARCTFMSEGAPVVLEQGAAGAAAPEPATPAAPAQGGHPHLRLV